MDVNPIKVIRGIMSPGLELSVQAKAVLVALYLHADPDGSSCFPGDALLALEASCSPRTVRRARREARTEGLLTWELKAYRKGVRNEYQINAAFLEALADVEVEGAARESAPRVRPESPDPCGKPCGKPAGSGQTVRRGAATETGGCGHTGRGGAATQAAIPTQGPTKDLPSRPTQGAKVAAAPVENPTTASERDRGFESIGQVLGRALP